MSYNASPLKLLTPVLWTLLVCLLLGTLPPLSYGAAPSVQESQIKAVYLYNFLHFVTWPDVCEAPNKEKPNTIGIIGSSPIGRAIDGLARRLSKTDKRPIKVMHYNTGDDFDNCQLLFVSPNEAAHFKDILASLKTPVLTIADTEDFLDQGGMITMVLIKNKVRYKINLTAAKAAGLRLNSQLLKSAVEVR